MKRSLHTLIDHLRRLGRPEVGALTDAQLLERWISQHDPAAFELLLWRHGPMVLSTCRRLLPRREDAEDAFQATFLVLLRKAASIRRREALAAWLHRVACRAALRVRTETAQRAKREQPLIVSPPAPQAEEPAVRDLQTILEEEIDRLPACYRRAMVLCCLEGKSQEEAARLLACPRGTVSSWLTRGRERLRQRLLRRGIVVSAAGLSAALTPDALASGGMTSLVGSLIRVASAVAAGGVAPTGLMSARTIALAEGMLRMMFMTKVKIVVAVSFVVALMAAGVGTLSHTTWASDPLVALPEKPPKEVPIALMVKPPKEARLALTDSASGAQEDGIAWGKAAHGLQAGIAFRRGDQTTYEVGQSVTFIVYLRNVSDKKINLSHIEPLFEERTPDVEDTDSRHFAVAPGPLDLGAVPIVHRSVEAGQQITLGYPWFRIRPLGWHGEVLGPTCCAEPGRYKVGYTSLVLRLNDGKDISLGTKQVELDIRKAENAKEDRSAKETPIVEKRGLPDVGNPEEMPYFFYSRRYFEIPFHIDPQNQEKTRELILLVSRDRGRTYTQVDRKSPTERKFIFRALDDGPYWFIVQQVDKQGHCMPANPSRVKPTMRVCVDTTPPVVTLQGLRDQNTVHLTWTAKDANLEDKPVRLLEWSDRKDGPWSSPIVSGPLPNTGNFTWELPDRMPSDFYVRIHVRDKAGNDGYAVAYIKSQKSE
jgi:RNA polymerase sigma factor (sigma-70 family)